MGDFVGQHVIDRAFDNWIAHLLREPDQLLEDVTREALESAVDSRHPRGRIFGLGARPEHFTLGKFAIVRADVFEQLQVDFRVARFVPDLTRHVELKFPRRIRKVVECASRRFHRLEFAGADTVHARLQEIFLVWHRVRRGESLLGAGVSHALSRQQNMVLGPRQPVDGNHPLHDKSSIMIDRSS